MQKGHTDMSANIAMIQGNIGSAPVLRFTTAGTPVANFTVATNEYFMQNDERVQRTEWHRVVVWGKAAQAAAQYLHKGSNVLVQGSIRHRNYESQGQTRYIDEIVAGVGGVTFLDRPAQSRPAEDEDIPAPSDEDLQVPFESDLEAAAGS